MADIIRVNDRVQIIETGPHDWQHLHKIGQVLVVANGVRFFVMFPDRTGAVFELHQLRKLTQAPPTTGSDRRLLGL